MYAFAFTPVRPPIILKVDVGNVVLGGEEHAAAVVLHKLRVFNIFFRESKKSPNNMNGVWCFVNLMIAIIMLASPLRPT